jgi:hypothetical protein
MEMTESQRYNLDRMAENKKLALQTSKSLVREGGDDVNSIIEDAQKIYDWLCK